MDDKKPCQQNESSDDAKLKAERTKETNTMLSGAILGVAATFPVSFLNRQIEKLCGSCDACGYLASIVFAVFFAWLAGLVFNNRIAVVEKIGNWLIWLAVGLVAFFGLMLAFLHFVLWAVDKVSL